jgi:type III secretory pathway component EscU
LLTPAVDKADGKILEVLLDSIIDIWFQKDEIDTANYEMWTATTELKSEHKELKGGSPGKSEAIINQDISKEITKAFKQNVRNLSRRMS